MTSPYLLRPLRTLDTVLSEREKEMERPVLRRQTQVFIEVETREEAEYLAPWAVAVIEVEGGWMVFDDARNAETWERQQ